MTTTMTTPEAFALLRELGAPDRLLRHAELVLEAAEELLRGLARLGVPVDAELVRVGAVLHDSGKSVHRTELDAPGHAHEADGERLLLARGVAPRIARVCRTHAAWRDGDFDDQVVALADKLWKGVRVQELEELVIAAAARAVGRPVWDAYVALDALFEAVAAGADGRLARS